MAEIHFIGSILGSSDFPSSELSCKWSIVVGDDWKLLEGDEKGQTHVDIPEDTSFTVWDHPIDVHYSTKSIEGWPKLQLQVYRQDSFDGYGFVNCPSLPGIHQLECLTWRPYGSPFDQVWAYFLGATPQLTKLDIIHSPIDRYRLTTVSMGKVFIELSVITRNFNNYGVVKL